MKYGSLLMILLPCIFGLMALYLLVMGLRGIVTRKPFLISSRWPLGLMLLSFTPSALQPFLLPEPPLAARSAMFSALRWGGPVMFVILAVFMWFAMRGYTAIAVTNASFRAGLLASLEKLNIPHEETLGAMRLPSVGADLQVVVSWIGIGQLKMKQRKPAGLLGDIARGMNEHYERSAVPVNLTSCIFYVIMGALMLVLAGTLLLMRFEKRSDECEAAPSRAVTMAVLEPRPASERQ